MFASKRILSRLHLREVTRLRFMSLAGFDMETTHHVPPSLKDCELDVNGKIFQQAMEKTRLEVEQLEQRLEQVRLGGGPEAVARHHSRGKACPVNALNNSVTPERHS